jgi:hypothetical protein
VFILSYQVLKGNIATDSAVVKLSGKDVPIFRGPAQCYDSEKEAYDAIMRGDIRKGSVLIIRYEGPKGSPGMPEMLSPGAALVGRDLGKQTKCNMFCGWWWHVIDNIFTHFLTEISLICTCVLYASTCP